MRVASHDSSCTFKLIDSSKKYLAGKKRTKRNNRNTNTSDFVFYGSRWTMGSSIHPHLNKKINKKLPTSIRFKAKTNFELDAIVSFGLRKRYAFRSASKAS